MKHRYIDLLGITYSYEGFSAIKNRVKLILQSFPKIDLYLMYEGAFSENSETLLDEEVKKRRKKTSKKYEIRLLAKGWKTNSRGKHASFEATNFNNNLNLHFCGTCQYTDSQILHALTILSKSFPDTQIYVTWYRYNKDIRCKYIHCDSRSWRYMEGCPVEYNRLNQAGTEILDSIRMFVLNEIDNQLVTVGGVNSDNQVILYVPSSFYPLRGQALFTLYDNQNVEFRNHCCHNWARIQEASKAQIDCLAFHYPNHRFVVYGINSKYYSSYEQTANMMLFRETFIKQYSELFKKRTSKSLF